MAGNLPFVLPVKRVATGFSQADHSRNGEGVMSGRWWREHYPEARAHGRALESPFDFGLEHIGDNHFERWRRCEELWQHLYRRLIERARKLARVLACPGDRQA